MSRIDDDVISVGDAFPQIDTVSALEGLAVLVRWKSGKQQAVDLGPNISSFKIYAPLRTDRALFETVHLVDSFSIAWGDDDAIDMHVSEIERLAGEAMEAADFKGWMAELDLTRDAAAALLGVSRRTVGYYLTGQEIPRYMALACAQLKATRSSKQSASTLAATIYEKWRARDFVGASALAEELKRGGTAVILGSQAFAGCLLEPLVGDPADFQKVK